MATTAEEILGGGRVRLFYSEEETAALLGIHRTTLRALAVEGRAPVEAVALTPHKRVYRCIDVERLAGVAGVAE